MRARQVAKRSGRVLLWLGASALIGGGFAAAAEPTSKEKRAQGRELFLREWVANDHRSHGGDGLGPVFNDSSCVACHNAGGAGGAGPASKNVDIITAFSNRPPQMIIAERRSGFLVKALQALAGIDPPPAPKPATPRPPDTKELIKTHAGFRTARSVVLHRFGTEPEYEAWRQSLLGMNQFGGMNNFAVSAVALRAQAEMQQVKMIAQFEGINNQLQTQVGEFQLIRSQRNPTALFGAGLIDSIPDKVLEEAAKAKHPGFPEIVGRVSRHKDGRIGRFGWKGQTPSLNDFVLTACAVELGLEVPGHPQGGLPQKPEAKAKGLDLTGPECDALLSYVRDLPRPAEATPPADTPAGRDIAAGKAMFSRIGCAACHSPKLGEVAGLYSDLLLHDMGPELGDVGQYGVFTPDSSEPEIVDPVQPIAAATPGAVPVVTTAVVEVKEGHAPSAPAEAVAVEAVPVQIARDEPPAVTPPAPPGMFNPTTAPGVLKRPTTGPANRQEWRTPPLWGVRDSGPYMHDGRAETLEQAIAQHGGEATRSASKYFELKPAERLQFQAFLKSLTAPTEALARNSD
jgi:CxxC motif-containing protein (DUF1111 family)